MVILCYELEAKTFHYEQNQKYLLQIYMMNYQQVNEDSSKIIKMLIHETTILHHLQLLKCI